MSSAIPARFHQTTQQPPLRLSGQALTIDDIVSVAVDGYPVVLAKECALRLSTARKAVLEASQAGAQVYGLTTGVGALKSVNVKRDEIRSFNRKLILSHRISSGAPLSMEIVRATILSRAQGLALGGSGVRPAVVDALLNLLNTHEIPGVAMIGSVGQADLAPLAEIAEFLIQRGLVLEEREALALIGANSLAIGWAALALDQMRHVLYALEAATALSMEALLYNPSVIDPAVYRAHPSASLEQSIRHLRHLLRAGTLLDQDEAPRLLQDPLSLRVAPQTHATAWEAYGQAVKITEAELASASDNPLLTADARFLAVGNFDSSNLATVLDYARLGLAQALTLACERTQKLLATQHSGLPTGLRERADLPEDGLALFGHGAAALAAEARLLAMPVSLELPTSSIAESVEDRIIMAPLGARRLDEQTELVLQLVAIEMVCAAQAIDLRQRQEKLGVGARQIYALVRTHVPFLAANDVPPTDLRALCAALKQSLLQQLCNA